MKYSKIFIKENWDDFSLKKQNILKKKKFCMRFKRRKKRIDLKGSVTLNRFLLGYKFKVSVGKYYRHFRCTHHYIGFKAGSIRITRKPFHYPLHRKKKR